MIPEQLAELGAGANLLLRSQPALMTSMLILGKVFTNQAASLLRSAGCATSPSKVCTPAKASSAAGELLSSE